MLKEASTKGLVAIGWSENGYRQLTNSKRPVSKPSDLDGLKIRTMQNPIHLDIWRTLGATRRRCRSPSCSPLSSSTW